MKNINKINKIKSMRTQATTTEERGGITYVYKINEQKLKLQCVAAYQK